MRKVCFLFLVFAVGTLSWAEDPWVVVTLDRIEFSGNLIFWPAFKGNPIMFASVVGTGNTYQKLAWPWIGWFTIADEGKELVQETEGIPLFALPEDRMGPRLGVAIKFLGNTKFDWSHSFVPDLLSELEETLREGMLLPSPQFPGIFGKETAADGGEDRIEITEAPYTNFETFVRFFNREAWATAGTRSYTAEVSEPYVLEGETPARIRFQYSVRKVFLPEGLRARVRLEGIKTVENGDFADGEVFILARAISGFGSAGRPVQQGLRIPSSGHFSMGDGEEKVLSVVLFEGEVRPFLYVEANVWDEDNPSLEDQHDLLGGFFGLWLPWRLSNLPGGEKRLIVPKGTPDGEVLIYLRIELL